MKQVQSSNRQGPISELLDEVERGETVVIARHGKPIARGPVPDELRARQGRKSACTVERHQRSFKKNAAFVRTIEEITRVEVMKDVASCRWF